MKKVKATKKTQAPSASDGDYAGYYKRIRAMAKDKGMKEDNVVMLLKDKIKGESAYRAWELSKKVKVGKEVKKNGASERLYALAEERRRKMDVIEKEKQAFEAEEVENLAHLHADKHIIQDNVRSIEQFMQDQIHYEQRKLARLKEVAHKQELMNLKTHHPRINVTS